VSELQEKVEKAIIETLQASDGAGSDLARAEDIGQGWLMVEGNIDIPHLASDMILVITGDY